MFIPVLTIIFTCEQYWNVNDVLIKFNANLKTINNKIDYGRLSMPHIELGDTVVSVSTVAKNIGIFKRAFSL